MRFRWSRSISTSAKKYPGELNRTSLCEISPGLTAPLVSKEDAILSKLLWIQQGSGKSRHDVIEMLKRDEDLDRAVCENVPLPWAC